VPTTPMAHSKLPSRTRKGRAAKETAVSILDVLQEAFLASLLRQRCREDGAY